MSKNKKPISEGYKPSSNSDNRGYQPNSLQHGYQPVNNLKPSVPSSGSKVPTPQKNK